MDREDELGEVAARYAFAVTPVLAALMDAHDPADPIARQFMPDARELLRAPEELSDPIGDDAHAPAPGVVHRYPDRVLLKPVHVCPAYCRFCFRREMVGPGKRPALTPKEIEAAFAYIEGHPEIWEVIVTGGDPFLLSPRRAAALTRRLESIAHVKVIRWHTRMATVDPARITEAFVRAIRSEKAVYVAVHANHPREFTPQARAALARMADAGLALVSQSVLLRGVNDDVDTLAALMRSFVEARVKPYYLHHPDLAPGTAHFRVGVAEGQALVRALRDAVSGLCQPAYVIDIPGGVSKALASPGDVRAEIDGHSVRGRDGRWRPYPPRV
ncbi:MAG: lysine-2,3-aminomutase-like protein [Hyphomonadaceae bacterium]